MRKMKMGMGGGFVLGEAEENKDTKLKGRKISWDTDDEETKKKNKTRFYREQNPIKAESDVGEGISRKTIYWKCLIEQLVI